MEIKGYFKIDEENKDLALDIIYKMIDQMRDLYPYLNLQFYTKK